MTVKFEVGSPFPLHNRARGVEQTRIDMNESLFDVCFYSSQSDKDRSMFTKGKLQYGVYEEQAIPFFILKFEEMSVDSSINFLLVKQEKADDWLNATGNIVNLYLIDYQTNILKGMRMISLTTQIVSEIRDTCKKQDGRYETHIEVNSIINSIVQKKSTEDMIKTIKLISL